MIRFLQWLLGPRETERLWVVETPYAQMFNLERHEVQQWIGRSIGASGEPYYTAREMTDDEMKRHASE